ncbi:MAG TPA: hypothetical protein VJB14_04640, partial [Planctomycetota bacterium]|nr:hypothetical protein [Planctomycetota bacterium]
MNSLGILLLALGQAQGVDAVIRRWKDEDPALREAASREVVRRWKEWSPADLKCLALAAMSSDGEVAARGGEAQAQVLGRRQFGEKLWPKIDKADALMARLKAGEQQSSLMGWMIPGGPHFDSCPLTKELLALGGEIEPYMRMHLTDPAVRSEIALVLSQTGGADSLPA